MTMSLKQAYRIEARARRRYWRHASNLDIRDWDAVSEMRLKWLLASRRVSRIEDDLVARGKAQSMAMPF